MSSARQGMTASRSARVLGELLGACLLVATVLLAYVLLLGGGLTTLGFFLAGCAALFVVAAVLRFKWLRAALPYRLLADLWLAALAPAALASWIAVVSRWPLRTRAVNAHGWGTAGGEANVLFLPWMHAALWLGIVLWWLRSERS